MSRHVTQLPVQPNPVASALLSSCFCFIWYKRLHLFNLANSGTGKARKTLIEKKMASIITNLFLLIIGITTLMMTSQANIQQSISNNWQLELEKARNKVFKRYPQLKDWAIKYRFPNFDAKNAIKDFIRSALSRLKWFQFPCPKDRSEKQAGLCYRPCDRPAWAFVKGVGPVCWKKPIS